MYINNSVQVGRTEQIQKNTYTDTKSTATDVSTSTSTSTSTDKVTISDAGRNAESKWQEISNKYDVTNMSSNELMKMSKELYDNKLISEKEYLLMYDPLGIDEDRNSKHNFLDIMRNDLNEARKRGDDTTEGINIRIKKLDILERLERLST
ncbi:hypothetical protein [Shewanella sp.]|uniref:hypothetical protein n=1 Tax=Shewanella sp. TaxID=50422 RepID=UPI001EB6A226|nr:hypothetical protein [Shewanella sp.]NRB25939.1 hypothetical protein [Shewanella sp.]